MTPLFPLGLCWIAGAVLLFFDGARRSLALGAAVLLLGVAGLDVFLLSRLLAGAEPLERITGGWPQGVGIRLRVDGVSLFFAALCAISIAAATFHEALSGVRGRLFPGLALLLCAGLHGAFFTGDLFNYYVFFELSVVVSFALAAYGYGRAELRATLVYIAVNLFGSVLFLLGVTGIYHQSGTLDLEILGGMQHGAKGLALMLPGAAVFVSLSIKLGLFPFHGWVPVLYGHARPATAATLSGALVNIGAYGMLRLGYTALAKTRERAAPALIVLGLAAAIYAALLVLRRRRAPEILAYASIEQAGFIVFAIGVGGPTGVVALLLVVLAGTLDKTTLFLSTEAHGPARSIAGLIAAIGVAGLPITAGFLEKVQLFAAGLSAPWSGVVTAVLTLISTLTAVGLLRVWRLLARDRETRGPAGPALALAALSVALGLAADPLSAILGRLSTDLLGRVA